MSTANKFFKVWARFLCEDMAETALVFLLLLLLMAVNVNTFLAAFIASLAASALVAFIEVKAVECIS